MGDPKVTSSNLGGKMYAAAKTSLGSRFPLIQAYLKAESEKLAITLRMIVEQSVNGGLSKGEAKILLNQQKVAASSVLTAAEV